MWAQLSQAYECMARCYIRLRRFQLALVVSKLQLVVGWRARDKEIELRAYDNIGMAYYYLGDLDAAQYYHNRMADGVTEAANSPWLRSAHIRDRGVVLRLEERHIGTQTEATPEIEHAREEILATEMSLWSQSGGTPRIVGAAPWEDYNPADLPSPRKGCMPKEPVSPMNLKLGRAISRYLGARFPNKQRSQV